MLKAQQFLELYCNNQSLDESLYPLVKNICDDVKVNGDAALKKYNLTFDHVDTTSLEISKQDIQKAYEELNKETLYALHQSYERIKSYQEKIKYTSIKKGECYEVYHPIERVGIYVPGGKASYPSTVLMTATLAQVANVEEIVVVTPPRTNGVSKEVLASCHLTGVNHVYQVGGAQSIAALTYGTETIKPVDKIVGPGNQYVALAKKYVYGDVGIDQIAGPTELAMIIDETAHIDAITYDIFAQAEHDEMARTFVISDNAQILQQLQINIDNKLKTIDRHSIVSKSIANHHYLIEVSDMEEACQILNKIAPEHASIQTKHPEQFINQIKFVGALFIGHYAPEAIGDYIAGPSHVLPTNQTARFSNGLSVNDFMTRHSVINLSKSTFKKVAHSAERLACVESLNNHQQSIHIRH